MIIVTGASGILGRMVVDDLLERVPADQVVAAVRDPGKVDDLAVRGVRVRHADHDRPSTLGPAFAGADRVLLVSGPQVRVRLPQHRAVIDAAAAAGAGLIAYTSILHADRTPMAMPDHLDTEEQLRRSRVPFSFLRHAWYSEVYIPVAQEAVDTGEILGASGDGRIAAAPRVDYAAAAAEVLTGDGHENSVYELSGDTAFTRTELAALVEELSGRPVVYRDLPPDGYRDALVAQGVPEPAAVFLAELEEGIAAGGLADTPGTLRRLIGRPTTPLRDTLIPVLQHD